MENLVVWVADVGSIKRRKFGWCRAVSPSLNVASQFGIEIDQFVRSIYIDLLEGRKIALGLECPLFVPIPEDPQELTSARNGEGNRAWSAGAGCGALAVGLTESVWIFEQIKLLSKVDIIPVFEWDRFTKGYGNIFIWEAFVTAAAKSSSHQGDAEIAANTFWAGYPNLIESNSVTVDRPYSLVGAALLRAGLTTDLTLLSKGCIVLKS